MTTVNLPSARGAMVSSSVAKPAKAFRKQILPLLSALGSCLICSQIALSSSWRINTDCTDPGSGLTMHEVRWGMARDRRDDHTTSAWSLREPRPEQLPTSAANHVLTVKEIETVLTGAEQGALVASFNLQEVEVTWHDNQMIPSDHVSSGYTTFKRTPYTRSVTLRRYDSKFLIPPSDALSLTAHMYCIETYRYNR